MSRSTSFRHGIAPALLVAFSACGGRADGGGSEGDRARLDNRAADTASATTPAPGPTAPGTTTPADWTGGYALRGTMEGTGQAAGSLTVDRLGPTDPAYAATRERVRRNYPSYEGPYYGARLAVGGGRDTVRASFTCALGPGESSPLVCAPKAPLAAVADATLIVSRDGRAVLTGSHGEGVSVEYARFTWDAAPGR